MNDRPDPVLLSQFADATLAAPTDTRIDRGVPVSAWEWPPWSRPRRRPRYRTSRTPGRTTSRRTTRVPPGACWPTRVRRGGDEGGPRVPPPSGPRRAPYSAGPPVVGRHRPGAPVPRPRSLGPQSRPGAIETGGERPGGRRGRPGSRIGREGRRPGSGVRPTSGRRRSGSPRRESPAWGASRRSRRRRGDRPRGRSRPTSTLRPSRNEVAKRKRSPPSGSIDGFPG